MGSGLKTHNCNTKVFKALVQVTVDRCDGAMKEPFPVCGFSSHKEGRDRSMAGEGLKRKTPLRSPLHLVSKGQEEQGKRSRWPAEFTAGRNCSSTKSLSDGREPQPDLCLPSCGQCAHFRVSSAVPIFFSSSSYLPLPYLA